MLFPLFTNDTFGFSAVYKAGAAHYCAGLFYKNQAECVCAASESIVQSVANFVGFNQIAPDVKPRFDVG
jgi:hypothetical protein